VFKNALVSVSNKTGLVDFLKPLVERGLRVVSTGGTLKYLLENGIPAVEVSDQTQFPEVMDGRVKTLHPRIHMPLLARSNNKEDLVLLEREGLQPFDLVIVNLYPFEEARKRGLRGDELLEFIDVGGPSMLRAAAKNFHRITVICDPADYRWIAHKTAVDESDRRFLAARVFSHTSRYDDLIAKTLLNPLNADSSPEADLVTDTLVGMRVGELRYGENPQQRGVWYRDPNSLHGLHEAEILNGKSISYNNLMDLDAALGAVREFTVAAAVALKHNNPCGVGTGSSVFEATSRALKADPVSVFGGIVAINRVVDLPTAQELTKIFLECVIAPGFSEQALSRLREKKDLRILQWPQMNEMEPERQFRSIAGGFLVQSPDRTSEWSSDWRVLGREPSESEKQDLILAWKVCAWLKSNAIALASGGQTVGLGMGQVNRVDAVEHAIGRMRKHHPKASHVVLASDAFFPFADSIELAAQAGIGWIIQPGGSIRDESVFAKAGELGVNMVVTGVRHFRH
jgi:phosphoribosylaminoimidazolecarboxamide formyltransferase/IMP cyclohydrolase